MTRSFRGFALDDTNGLAFKAGGIKDAPTVTGKRLSLKGDGDGFRNVRRGGRAVELAGTVVGTSEANLHDRVRDLLEQLHDPTLGTLILDTYELECYSKPGKISYLAPTANSLQASWSCTFQSEFPYWTDPTPTLTSKTLTNNAVSEETFPVTYGASLAETYPVIKIEQLGASTISNFIVTLVNDATGDEFRLKNFTLGQNDVLKIDPEVEQVWIATDTSGLAVVPERVDGVFWPGNGATFDVTVKHNQIGLSPNFKVTLELYKRHFSYKS